MNIALRNSSLLMLAVAMAVSSSGCSKSKADEVQFVPYDLKAVEAAKSQSKPVVIMATADWCPPCKLLHEGALTDDNVKAALAPFARLEIDCSSRDESCGEALGPLGIESLPTLVFLDASGSEAARLIGNQPAAAIIAAAKKATGS